MKYLIMFGPSAVLVAIVATGYALNWRKLVEIAQQLERKKQEDDA